MKKAFFILFCVFAVGIHAQNETDNNNANKMAAMFQIINGKVSALNNQTAEIIDAANRFYGQAEESDRITEENKKMAEDVEKMIGEIIEFPQKEEEAEIGHAKVA